MELEPAQAFTPAPLSKAYSAMVRKYHEAKGALTLEGVTDYLGELAKTARPSTVRVAKYAMQRVLLDSTTDARAHELIRSAFRRIKTPRPDRTVHAEAILSREQVESMTAGEGSPRARLLVKVLSETGTRLSEALGMRLSDCTVEEGQPVAVRIIGKGSKERRVFLHFATYAEAREVFAGKTYLLETANGKQIAPSAGRSMVYAMAKRARLKGVHPHTFRHSWATAQIKQGASLKAVSKYLGHSGVAITSDYYDHNELSALEALGGVA